MNEHGKSELDNEPDVDPNAAFEPPAGKPSGAGQSTDEAFLDQSVSDAPETRDDEMDRLRQTAAEADKRVLQAQAEAENFRKRMRRDFEDQVKFASTDLVVDLLQVRDNLMRAIEAAKSDELGDQGAGLREGVAMVVKQMDDMLAKHGIVEIPADGEDFDPNVHEAISQMPCAVGKDKIAHVAVSGFKLHDRVIRPSQVVVSTGPA